MACVGLAITGGSSVAASAADRVVWREGDTFYVATNDSGSIVPGMELCLSSDDREVACGEVTGVLDGIVASVRRTRGDLASWNGTLGSLDVRRSPRPAEVPASLRLGLPAASRSSLAFACSRARLDAGMLPRAYRIDSLGSTSFRFVTIDTSRSGLAWPDTLHVRLFADRDDEGIALERGEVDVAVFWPGEAPASLREASGRFTRFRGTRARGALVLAGAPRDTGTAAAADADLAWLNQQLFAGDLRVWQDSTTVVAPRGGAPLRLSVDATLPGQRAMTRALEARHAAPTNAGVRETKLAYLDVDVSRPDSLARAWRPRGIRPVLTMRCALFCRTEFADVVRALGADPFANLLQCADAGSPR